MPVDVAVVIVSVRPPDVDVAKVCTDDVEPLSDVSPPPAPASPAQLNVPSVQISFCVAELQFVSAAP